ncbi:MAG: transposase [Deltaproteobacteria bacterium]|jgi:hypothetical protein|nr:transposase [Deltaproteobacteria bacterium]
MPFFKADIGRLSQDLLTDAEVLSRLKYDERFRWALDIQELNDTNLYESPKTLSNFRLLVKEKDLESENFNKTTDDLINQFEVDCSLQRLALVLFNSNMLRLTRQGLMTKTVEKFLRTLKTVNLEAFKTMDQNLSHRYLKSDRDVLNAFSYVRPSSRERLMLTVVGDIFSLITSFQSNFLVAEPAEFKLLERVFRDQCQVSKEARAYFNHDDCQRCPGCGQCPVTISKKKAFGGLSARAGQLDKRRTYQPTYQFKNQYRMHSGMEATNSQLSQIGLKRWRVRGRKSASFKIHFKALP